MQVLTDLIQGIQGLMPSFSGAPKEGPKPEPKAAEDWELTGEASPKAESKEKTEKFTAAIINLQAVYVSSNVSVPQSAPTSMPPVYTQKPTSEQETQKLDPPSTPPDLPLEPSIIPAPVLMLSMPAPPGGLQIARAEPIPVPVIAQPAPPPIVPVLNPRTSIHRKGY